MHVRCVRATVTALLLAVGGSVSVGAESPLVEAIKTVDRAAVRSLLQKHADVNVPEPDGTTALYWAAEKNDREIADLLIRAGANANARTRYGVTPLTMASLNGSATLIEMLLKAGADPNTATVEGETVLMIAARTVLLRPSRCSSPMERIQIPRKVTAGSPHSCGPRVRVTFRPWRHFSRVGPISRRDRSRGGQRCSLRRATVEWMWCARCLMPEPTRMRVWNGPVGPAEVEAPAAEARNARCQCAAAGGRKQPLRAGGVFVGQGRRSELGQRRMDRAASDNVDAQTIADQQCRTVWVR